MSSVDNLEKWLALQPEPDQYLERLTRTMTRCELQELVLVMLAYLAPIERTALLDAAAAITDARPFVDGRRRR